MNAWTSKPIPQSGTECCHHPRKFSSMSTTSPHRPAPLSFFSPCIDFACYWPPSVWLKGPASFAQQSLSEIRSHCRVRLRCPPGHCPAAFCCKNVTWLVSTSFYWWMIWSFLILCRSKWCCHEYFCLNLFVNTCFHFLGGKYLSGVARS